VGQDGKGFSFLEETEVEGLQVAVISASPWPGSLQPARWDFRGTPPAEGGVFGNRSPRQKSEAGLRLLTAPGLDMLFNSFQFWIFFALVLGLYWRLGHKAQNRLLLVASYVFYGWWDWRFLSLIVVSTVVDYLVGLRLISPNRDEARKKWLVALSVCVNLGLLGVFKYSGFFVESAGALLDALGFQAHLPTLRIILPVGISFYTFQTLSYTVDVYRGKVTPTRDFLDFALFVSFFPQLVAGPIERAKRLLPQVSSPRQVTRQDFQIGLYCIVFGLFKKVVVADNMAVIADHVFAMDPATVSNLEVWLGVLAFTFQVYGDFHGYSLIAQGTARWMGFHIMDNFRQPFFATSPREFWHRWHISLSSWLRDYLYIPLGGSRRGTVRTYVNLMTTMVLGGLWHGAAWTYVLWGTIHGGWLAIHRLLSVRFPPREESGTTLHLIKVFLTFLGICVTMLFFRSESVADALTFFFGLFSGFEPTRLTRLGFPLLAFYTVPMLLYEVWVERTKDLFAMTRAPLTVRVIFLLTLIFFLVWFPAPVRNEFVYFQF
jgi:alginate O-acetyltransferase complex protein AlgI